MRFAPLPLGLVSQFAPGPLLVVSHIAPPADAVEEARPMLQRRGRGAAEAFFLSETTNLAAAFTFLKVRGRLACHVREGQPGQWHVRNRFPADERLVS